MSGRLVLNNVTKVFRTRGSGKTWWRKEVTVAVKNVSLSVRAGEVLALVGESGSGKTTVALLAARLIKPLTGEIAYCDDASNDRVYSNLEFSRLVQIVFQDPSSALNPRHTAQEILSAPLILHEGGTRSSVVHQVFELLERVGLRPAELYADRFPHQLSGGQKQRLCIARALSVQPNIVIADEPVSALDVSVQGQILHLLLDLQRLEGIGVLLVSHDLAVVSAVADRVAVMYCGRVVEIGNSAELFQRQRHPYTQLLLASTPDPNPATAKLRSSAISDRSPLAGAADHGGCPFEPRCPLAHDRCVVEPPSLTPVGRDHEVACYAVES